ASALGDRAFVHRLAGRLDQAARDFDEAMDLCRRLGEKSLISWTASQLALVRLAQGDLTAARKLVEDPAVQPGPADVIAEADLRSAAAVVDLAEGDRERSERRLMTVLASDRRYPRNQVAERVWLIGRLLGEEAAGGVDGVEESRRTLEEARWLSAFRSADLAAEAAQLQPA